MPEPSRGWLRGIRSRQVFFFLLVSLLPLMIGGALMYEKRVGAMREREFNKLAAIRELKLEQLGLWITERTSDLATLAEAVRQRLALQRVTLAGTDRGDLSGVNQWLATLEQRYPDYFELFVLDRKDGLVTASSNPNRVGQDRGDKPYFVEPLRNGRVFLGNVYYSQAESQLAMVVAAPIFASEAGSDSAAPKVAGVLVGRIDPEQSLFPLLLNPAGLGRTGETLILDRRRRLLSPQRHSPHGTGEMILRHQAAERASKGESGVMQVTDASGREVLVAYGYLPSAGWGFLAKQDVAELAGPVNDFRNEMIMFLLAAGVLVCPLAILVARSLARPVTDMAAVAGRLRQGDLSARADPEAPGELGYLAAALNQMAQSLERRVHILRAGSELGKEAARADKLTRFAQGLLDRCLEQTGAHLGALFLRQDGQWGLAASRGLDPEPLARAAEATARHWMGQHSEGRRIRVEAGVAPDTEFIRSNILGESRPRSLLGVPLLAGDDEVGLLVLGSLGEFSSLQVELMEHLAPVAASALGNLLSTARTRRLAEDLAGKNQELEANYRRNQELGRELEQQAAELKRQNQELAARQRQVEQANRLKSEFLSNMSHELRTPLNSVLALSKLLLMGQQGEVNQEQRGCLEIIERNGRNLLQLINDILDISKIESGRIEIHTAPVPLAELLETLRQNLAPLAEAKGLGFEVELPPEVPALNSDEGRLYQILQNLVSNAVKFTEQGRVRLALASREEGVAISVEDTGIGIDPEQLPQVFEEFRQVDGSPSRAYEGTGLGLSIAAKLSRLLGGRLEADSRPGKGSRFTLVLPWSRGESRPSAPRPLTRPPRRVRPKWRSVLVVDDDPEVAATIGRCLNQEGYHVLTAGDGPTALELARKHRPFAVTLDVLMPEMDGWEVLQRLKNDPLTADIPVVIVSVSPDRETGAALGAVGYVAKPINPRVLLKQIKSLGGPRAENIWVVDDEEVDREEIKRAIAGEGYQVLDFAAGQPALERLRRDLPDLLVLDLIMPQPDGFAMLEALRSQEHTRDLPVIVVTAQDLDEEERRRLNGKVNSVLQKQEVLTQRLLEEISASLEGVGPPRPARGRPTRLLLVEDNEVAVLQVRPVLEREGYLVEVARDGAEALELMAAGPPDGVILDLMMPGMDGFEMLERMQGLPELRGAPVLVLTAKDLTTEDMSRLAEADIRQLVQKGDIDLDGLLAAVESMVGPGLSPRQTQAPREVRVAEARGRQGLPPEARVLVVEDNADNMTTVELVLGGRVRLLKARDGQEGLDTALAELPDAVLLDMALPKLDGQQVVGRLKAHPRAARIPVIALSAQAMAGDRERFLDAGCDDYIAKPLDPGELLEKLERWLAGREQTTS